MVRMALLFLLAVLVLPMAADTLQTGGKTLAGVFAGYEKGRVLFQEWTAAEPQELECRRVERLKISKPTSVKYTMSGAPKKVLTSAFLGYKNGFFLFQDGDEDRRHYARQIGKIEVKIDYQTFMAEAQRAAAGKDGAGDEAVPVRAAEMVVDNQVTLIHFHHEGSAASTRQGNFAQRLCEESRGAASYIRVLVKDGDDPVAKANKLRSLPQFWFYDRDGELSSKLADRFTEEDISKALQTARKGR